MPPMRLADILPCDRVRYLPYLSDCNELMQQNQATPERSWAAHSSAPMPVKKPQRRLKPEVAAKLAARRTAARLHQLYEKPVQELSPEELAQMKAAFFRG